VGDAISEFQDALRLRPDFADAHNNLGLALVRQGKVTEGIYQFMEALRLSPNHPQARENLADAHYQAGLKLAAAGDEVAAVRHLREAARLDSTSPKYLNSLAWLLATTTHSSVDDRNEAVALGEQAAQLTGRKNPMILDTLAAAYAGSDRFSEATRVVSEAIVLASAAGNQELLTELRSRLERYQSNRRYYNE